MLSTICYPLTMIVCWLLFTPIPASFVVRMYGPANLSRMSPSWTKAYATLRTKDPALFASPKKILVLPGLVCGVGGGGWGVTVIEYVFWTVTAVAKNTFSDHYMLPLVQSVVCRDHNAQWLKYRSFVPSVCVCTCVACGRLRTSSFHCNIFHYCISSAVLKRRVLYV